ncbi:DUF3888 domain-containing protein [Anaerotruncus sp. X29]|nr:DUF3888 domain-containing protein [Anaerotruncus sp. 1XD42-93]NCE76932.1 DUF3888 domain-containing protein [Anaerotruncus sp. X29]RKJ80220.1 DUF3888 domain-containing protein [Anaerotruncus sp. 1XD22-93]
MLFTSYDIGLCRAVVLENPATCHAKKSPVHIFLCFFCGYRASCLRGAAMRKLSIFTASIITAITLWMATSAAAEEEPQGLSAAAEQVILRLLHQPTTAAVEEYYGGHRQYWRQEVLNVQKVPESPYYEVVIQVETFYGAHNPPYGLETLTFYIGPLDNIQLASFVHQTEAE